MPNLEFLPDFYHFKIAQNYFLNQKTEQYSFDVFFRDFPFKGGYVVFAGLQPLLEFLVTSFFTPQTISFLREEGSFSSDFLSFLQTFQFKGDIFSAREGELLFPYEPFMRFEGNAIETHLIEGLVLNTLNFQTLIATKAARIFYEVKDKSFLELGLRRAYGADGAYFATRSSYIGGAAKTSNVVAASHLKIPITGSMSHSFVMAHPTELEAFISFGKSYPNSPIFLLDTYNTLNHGIKNAITAFIYLKANNLIDPKGVKGVRLDSGDLDYLSKEVRKMLDVNGLQEVKIFVTNELDEVIIKELISVKAPIDVFGVGTNLVMGGSGKTLGAVYKMAAEFREGIWHPKMKISNNISKTSIPGRKGIFRFFDEKGFMVGDLLFLEEEKTQLLQKMEKQEPMDLNHPYHPHIRTCLKNYSHVSEILSPRMKEGKILSDFPKLNEVRDFFIENFCHLHESHKRITNPHLYKVGFSEKLVALYKELLEASH